MLSERILEIIEGCKKNDRLSQRRLYEHFYGYGMSICLRYTHDRHEAADVLNRSFFKVFRSFEMYDSLRPFQYWLRTIIINTAIDYFRQKEPLFLIENINLLADFTQDDFEINFDPDDDILEIMQALSPAYRTILNLFVMEELSHREIAELLGISESTSRSNLMRAKRQFSNLWLEKKTKRLINHINVNEEK